MDRVLFACRHNAGRSQMAAAFFNRLADPNFARAISAGTTPGDRVHPEVSEAMKEVGIDPSGAKPQLLTTEVGRAPGCSSRSVAVKSAPFCRESRSRTGRSRIRRINPSLGCVRSGTRSRDG